jgi:predicted metal-dependent phosphoesterase TrpH
VNRVDLHVHSTASDGKLAPEEVVRQAAALGIRYLALTDHDTVDGIVPAINAARPFPHLIFIPGIEVSTDVPEGEIHVLGYFIDYTSPELTDRMKRFRDSREGRARKMVDKLVALGIDIDYGRVQEIAGEGSIGRPHIAQAMLEKGYVSNFKEAFDKYIGRDGPAYVEREKMTPEEAVALILRSGGIPVLAHPFTVTDPEKRAAELKQAGLVGIEAYYKDNTSEMTKATLKIAKDNGLIATGGTDYHGIEGSGDVPLGSTYVPVKAARTLIKLATNNRESHTRGVL